MNPLTRNLMTLLLASAFAVPVALFAAEIPADAHESHHPVTASPADTSVQPAPLTADQLQDKMQTRMRAMQQISDPQARMSLMMVQMQDMQDMMKGMSAGCPMAKGKGGKGMRGRNMHGHMGSDSAGMMPGSASK